MSLLADTLGIFLSLVLLVSAAHKMLEPRRLGTAAAKLARMPEAIGMTLARGAAAVEALAALAILMTPTRQGGAIAAALLWLAYAVTMWRASSSGATFDCGCTLGGRAGRASPGSAVSPLLLSLGAALLTVAPDAPGIDAAAPFAAAAFLALRFAAEELSITSRQRLSTAA